MTYSSFRKLVIIGVALGAVAFFWGITNRFILAPKAQENKVSVTMSPKSGSLPPGKPHEVDIIIQAEKQGQKIAGVDARLSIENGTFTSLADCSAVGGASEGLFSDLVSRVDGASARKSCVSLKPDSEIPSGVIVKAAFTCTAAGPVSLKFDTGTSQVVGNIQQVVYGYGNVEEASFSCGGDTGSPAPSGPTVQAAFTPSTCTAGVGEACSYTLNFATGKKDQKISGYRVKLTYDPKVLSNASISPAAAGLAGSGVLQAVTTPTPATNAPGPVVTNVPPVNPSVPPQGPSSSPQKPPDPSDTSCTSNQDCINIAVRNGICKDSVNCGAKCVTPPGECLFEVSPTPSAPTPLVTAVPGKTGCFEVENTVDEAKGEIYLTYACVQPQDKLPASMSANLKFIGAANGSGTLSIASTEVVGNVPGYSYAVQKQDASYTIGAGGGSVSLDITARLQGVIKKPRAADTVKMRVGVRGEKGTADPVFTTTELKVGDDGLWRGTASINAPAGPNYCVLLKGERHMQKKLGSTAPTENFPGAYRADTCKIDLKSGANNIDASKIVLLVGDLDPQDGISNAHDQSLVRNMLGRSDDECKRLADVNYDGVCNAIDHSLMIAALSVRYDEQ